MDRRSVHRLLRLGFLSPPIVEAIAEGRQSPNLTVIGLIRGIATYSIEIWFKTTTQTGGKLIGFGNTMDTAS